ncbi:malonate transporter [Aquirufa rosea]|uniref:Malonate transporter n=2 Tax=Aquirufa rosea TaxID=2509241 RepID=A0A4V1M5F8_9BACT|nr:malonate transporter [Aquirufa rosea]
MLIYGLGLLALSYLAGQLFGDFLGEFIGVQANVGGVGFAMLTLVLLHNYFQKKHWIKGNFDDGIGFWSNLYIPVIVAMSASQNALLAFNHGILPLVAGILIVVLGFALVPLISTIKTTNE